MFYSMPNSNLSCSSVRSKLFNGLSSGSTFPVGKTTVEFEVITDNYTQNCKFNVNIKDITGPTLTCPNDREEIIDGNNVSVNLQKPKAFDNCNVKDVWLVTPTSSIITTFGEHMITWNAIDAYGNSSSCSYKLSIKPVLKKKVLSSPVVQANNLVPSKLIQIDSLNIIKCLTDTAIYTKGAICGAFYTYALPNNSKLISGIQSGKKFTVGNNKIVYEVFYKTNSKKCEFTATVLDTIKPNIVCLLDEEVWFEASEKVNYRLEKPKSNDNCYISRVSLLSQANEVLSKIGSYNVVWEAEDNSGNLNTCSQSVVLKQKTDSTKIINSIEDKKKVFGEIEEKDKFSFDVDKVYLKIWDSGVEDGDTISLYYNGLVMLDKVRLRNHNKKPFVVKLDLNEKDENEVIIKAWNNGEISVNTITVKFFYDFNLRKKIKMKNKGKFIYRQTPGEASSIKISKK